MLIRWLPILILALFRFWDLGARPIHHDEAVNGWFVDGIFSRGYYSYDPQNYHGPFFFYVLTLFEKLFGRSVEVMRATTVLAGAAVTLSPWLFRRWIGETAAWVAAAVLAVSPAMVFFSRYAIHEMFFMLAIILFFYNWLRVREEGFHLRSVLGFGLTFGLLASIKENFVLYGGSIILAESIIWATDRRPPVRLDRKFWAGLGSGFAIGAVFIVLCYTAFFMDGDGVRKFIQAFELWSDTGSKGNGHQKPWSYWIGLLADFEWGLLLGLIVLPFYAIRGSGAIRLLAWSSAIHFAVYSIVAYKTPWCMLSFAWGLALLAGVVLASGLAWKSGKFISGAALMIVTLKSGSQAWDVAWKDPDQDGHPYIYGQTYRDLVDQSDAMWAEINSRPGLKDTFRVQVVSSFTWPLPYLFGGIQLTAFHGRDNAPPVLDADWIWMDQTFESELGPRLNGTYTRTEVRSRQWASSMVVFRKKQGP
jgi:uncharacterized protein (TIGR03663 family)